MTTGSMLLPREKKEKPIGFKASSSASRKKELSKNVATGAALHHPGNDPRKSNQEKPITGCCGP